MIVTLFDSDSFGSLVRLNLRLPTNIMQRLAYRRAKRLLGYKDTPRFTLPAVISMNILNRWAKLHRSSDYADSIYWLKRHFMRCLYHHGYFSKMELEQQKLECYACERGVWHRGAWDEDTCWRCHGTGVYKRIYLVKFTVEIGEHPPFEFHQPLDLCQWVLPVLASQYPHEISTQEYEVEDERFWHLPRVETLPMFKDVKHTAYFQLSAWDLQKHLLMVAYFVASRQMFEDVKIQPWQSALRHDARELANRIARRWSRIWERMFPTDLPF